MGQNQTKSKALFADFTLIIMVVIWGSTFFMIKEHIQYVDPVGMLFYRFLAAAVILGVFLVLRKKPLFQNALPGFIVGFFLWLIYVPQNIGLVYTSASNSGFITALFVVFVPIFSIVFFKKWPAMTRIFAALLSLIGLWFLTGGFDKMNRGDFITLISPIAVTFYVLFSDKYLKNNLDPVILCFQQFLVVSILSLIWMLFFDLPFSIHETSTYGVIAFLTIFATVMTFLVYNFVQKISTPMKATLILALEPVFAALFAWLYGGETFVARQMFGGFLIVAAMVISELPTDKIRRRTEKTIIAKGLP